MATIYLRTPTLVNADGDELTYDEALAAYKVPFNPKPRGRTDTIYLNVTCLIVPANTIKARFTLSIIYPDSYQFVTVDGKYTKDVATDMLISLPFDLERLNPIGTGFNCDLKLVAKDKAAGSTLSLPQYLSIKGI